jgi:hypothetical protein
MTDEQRSDEGAEETIEDLDAPAAAQSDVAGGMCMAPSELCRKPTEYTGCAKPTCKTTEVVVQAI